jgi:hypothetical protein
MSKVEVNQISSQCGSTLTIGQSGDTVTLACGATQTGFGRTGTVDWDTTAKTASFTAVSGNGYFVNTTSGAITVTLPAGSGGSIVSLKDYANTWNTNNVTVAPNGTDKINGTNGNAVLSTQDQSVTLVYVDSTKGWRAVQDSTSAVDGAQYITATGGTVTCCGDYKIHTFTGPGTFTVTCAGNSAGSNTVDYLVVAGGGGTGADNGGGGGAGGFRYSASTFCAAGPGSPLANPTGLPVSATTYPITVGGGGAGTVFPSLPSSASSGSPSIFSTITSTGGGYGNSCASNTPQTGGGPGGSGGGAGQTNTTPLQEYSGGTGNTPPVAPSQGNPGGNMGGYPSSGAGGGGAMAAGSGKPGTGPGPATGLNGGVGAGIPTAFGSNGETSGCYQYYSGGGGGGSGQPGSGPGGTGGTGGGGNGGNNSNNDAEAGTANTGGGGGGGAQAGNGIVVIRYRFQ